MEAILYSVERRADYSEEAKNPTIIMRKRRIQPSCSHKMPHNYPIDKCFSVEMHPVLPHLRRLNCYNRPDYLMIYKCFLKLVEHIGVKYDDKYDWETDEQVRMVVSYSFASSH